MPHAAPLASAVAHALCAGAYLALAALILAQAARRRRLGGVGALLAAACLATAAWASAEALRGPPPLRGAASGFDLARALAQYAFVLYLYRRAGPPARTPGTFGWLGLAALAATLAALLCGTAGMTGRLGLVAPAIALRLGLAVGQLLLLENLYRNAAAGARWHLNLACIALGALAAFDIVLCADAALFHAVSPVLAGARPLVALLAAPLLAVAAARNRHWAVDLHVSRGAAFHTATLAASGVFLVALAGAGELARRLGDAALGTWGGVAQVTLLCAGLLAVAVLLASGSARGALRAVLVDHFFTSRFDYRHEWMRCVATLSGDAGAPVLHARVIQAVAQIVDSPAGVLLLREPREHGLHWAGSWNMPALAAPVPPGHALLPLLGTDQGAVELEERVRGAAPLDRLGATWLAVPLRHRDECTGCVIVARPRAPFRLDREVADLLRVVGGAVAGYLAEQRATRALVEARDLHAYGERFAFVAHDIKNVASQLALLLSNAERHVANPEFQRDMLGTIAASVRKISALIQRLGEADAGAAPTTNPFTDTAARLREAASRLAGLHGMRVELDPGAGARPVAIEPGAFDAVVAHLLDNAVRAAGARSPIAIRIQDAPGVVTVDITDAGPGMTAEFVRDALFRPLRSGRRDGSGIGAFQARALLRAAGGDLLVISAPGAGTTMRLLLPPA